MRQMYFADTSYFIALLDADDDWHLVADRFARSFKGTLLTTGCVLLELGAFFSSPVARPAFARLDQLIRHRKDVIYVPLDAALHDAGTELFLARSDKEWSLADCVSFVVMKRYDLHDALTTDHHFEQAGFSNRLAK